MCRVVSQDRSFPSTGIRLKTGAQGRSDRSTFFARKALSRCEHVGSFDVRDELPSIPVLIDPRVDRSPFLTDRLFVDHLFVVEEPHASRPSDLEPRFALSTS